MISMVVLTVAVMMPKATVHMPPFFLKRKITMTYQRAILLLSQMYLPQFDEEEKEALTLAIYALEHERYLVQEERKNETQKRN